MNKSWLVALLVLFVTFMADAVEVKNLYVGKILVMDKTQPTRIKAHRWAIEQVLTKVTGSREILANKTVSYEVRTRTANYIKSFSFQTDEQGRTFLVDEFDQAKIDALVRKVGASIWGQRRPLTAFWMVIEEGVTRSFVSAEPYPQMVEVITQSAEDRGLPVIMPLIDQVDKNTVFPSDVWARFESVVDTANQRYQTDHFVMARMRYVEKFKEPEYETGWLLEFSLYQGKNFLMQSSFNGEQFYVIKEMINAVGDYFAKKYAIQNEVIQQQDLIVTIADLNNIIHFKKAEKYLSELPPVKKASLIKLDGTAAEFKLWLSGQALDVIKAMSLLPSFQRVESTVKRVEKELSVEEQLEQLTQEYRALQSGSTATSQTEPETKPIIHNLKYKWIEQ